MPLGETRQPAGRAQSCGSPVHLRCLAAASLASRRAITTSAGMPAAALWCRVAAAPPLQPSSLCLPPLDLMADSGLDKRRQAFVRNQGTLHLVQESGLHANGRDGGGLHGEIVEYGRVGSQ